MVAISRCQSITDNSSNNQDRVPHGGEDQLAVWSGYFSKTLEARQEQLASNFPHVDPSKLIGVDSPSSIPNHGFNNLYRVVSAGKPPIS
jgi:hypothetical protein